MKIGILGGTFNPIHLGHIVMAIRAKEELSLDKVYIMPSGNPPHKEVAGNISKDSRFNLARAGMSDCIQLSFSDFEYRTIGECYSYIILKHFKEEEHPDDELWFLIGEDSFLAFDSWVKPEKICEYVNIAVTKRPKESGKEPGDKALKALAREYSKKFGTKFVILGSEPIDISSTGIRQLLLSGNSPKEHEAELQELIPTGAYRYIVEHRLYESFDNVTADKKPFDFAAAEKKLSEKLSPSRFRHSLGVCATACALAVRYDYPVYLAKIASLLHDCAKNHSDKELIKFCEKHDIPISDAERRAPYLLHAKAGVYIARKKYGVEDPEILDAIENHTTGKPGMSLLSKIIFVADYIEPNRDKAENLDEIRQIAFTDLDLCCAVILRNILNYLEKTGAEIDKTTFRTCNFYEGLFVGGTVLSEAEAIRMEENDI